MYCCFVCSCKKSALSIKTDDNTGTWVLTKTCGGFAGETIIPSGHKTVSFEHTGKFTSSVDYATPQLQVFTDYVDESIFNDNFTFIKLSFDNGNETSNVIELNGDILVLPNNVYDGYSDFYERRGNSNFSF